jgi:hypothetical protein
VSVGSETNTKYHCTKKKNRHWDNFIFLEYSLSSHTCPNIIREWHRYCFLSHLMLSVSYFFFLYILNFLSLSSLSLSHDFSVSITLYFSSYPTTFSSLDPTTSVTNNHFFFIFSNTFFYLPSIDLPFLSLCHSLRFDLSLSLFNFAFLCFADDVLFYFLLFCIQFWFDWYLDLVLICYSSDSIWGKLRFL